MYVLSLRSSAYTLCSYAFSFATWFIGVGAVVLMSMRAHSRERIAPAIATKFANAAVVRSCSSYALSSSDFGTVSTQGPLRGGDGILDVVLANPTLSCR